MKNPKIAVSVRWIQDNWLWEKYCKATGTSLWAVNEGLMDSDESVVVPPALVSRVSALLARAARQTDGDDDDW